jgi:hypothetical protein
VAAEGVSRVLLVGEATARDLRVFEEASTASGVALLHAGADTPLDVIVTRALQQSVQGVLALGPASARVAAAAAETLHLPWHTPEGVHHSTNRLRMRGRLMAMGLPNPWFFAMTAEQPLASVADRLRFPCVIKPAAVDDGRAAIRADEVTAFERAWEAMRGGRSADAGALIVEGFVPGRELALEGVLEHGALRVLAIVDRAGASGPPLTRDEERVVAGTIAHAASALGLTQGPVHAVCRANRSGVLVLEIVPWPPAAPETMALRFATLDRDSGGRAGISLEELLVRQAAGESLDGYGREAE